MSARSNGGHCVQLLRLPGYPSLWTGSHSPRSPHRLGAEGLMMGPRSSLACVLGKGEGPCVQLLQP